jgi:diadenosine tetraphosphate (Ap4A) HIT family hydrolase
MPTTGRAWPADWDERKRGTGCAMCADGRPEDNGHGLRVFVGRYSDAYLQRADVGQRGYTIAVWRGHHVAEPTELSPEQSSGYFAEVLRVAKALETHYRPIKMNLEMLGNALPHLHTHLVPRYGHDGAPGRPARFMQEGGVRGARLPEDAVRADAAALRALLTDPPDPPDPPDTGS